MAAGATDVANATVTATEVAGNATATATEAAGNATATATEAAGASSTVTETVTVTEVAGNATATGAAGVTTVVSLLICRPKSYGSSFARPSLLPRLLVQPTVQKQL